MFFTDKALLNARMRSITASEGEKASLWLSVFLAFFEDFAVSGEKVDVFTIQLN